MRRLVFPLVVGVLGCAVLAALGAWQLQRLAWKEGILSEMEARLTGDPVALSDAVDPYTRFAAVQVEGRTTGEELHVLQSTGRGAGYRLISVLDTGDGRILLDEGLIPADAKDAVRGARDLTVLGNLHAPDDWTGSTPEPDLDRNIWYGRDLTRMAGALNTDPVYVVARRIEAGEAVATPLPLDTTGIANNHLGYAVQWFGLALVWAGMTGYWLWRKRRGPPEEDR